MTLAVLPRCTNVPRPARKDPKDTPDRAFNKLAWGNQYYGTEGVHHTSYVRIFYRGWVRIQIRKPDPPRTTITMHLRAEA